jgi:Domain of unknown function (DUF4268)
MVHALGKLETVPLRDVWPHEGTDFTPWLAEAENLAMLGEALELGPLQLQGTEERVGNFFIDILARDLDDKVVVIENQFGDTNHTHLGQIMTYVGGQDGPATVVWIAEKIRPEHRAAVDWLNRNTHKDFNFFAVEVEALRIGDSLPAPWFNVVAKPNDWTRDVARLTRSADAPLDDRAKAYTAYWEGFATFLRERNAPYEIRGKPRDYWCGFAIGRTGFNLSVWSSFRDRRIAAELYIGHQAAKLAFDLLKADQDLIEREFPERLDWQRRDGKKASKILVVRADFNPNDETQRTDQYEWFLDQLERFTRAFRDRIRNLSLDVVSAEQQVEKVA